LKALTIRQPWASLIIYGPKDVENRTWKLPQWMVGQKFAVHASKTIDQEDMEAAFELCRQIEGAWTPDVAFYAAVRGAVLGTTVAMGCVTESDSPFFFGPFGFLLRDRKALDLPIPARGFLGFWEWDPLA